MKKETTDRNEARRLFLARCGKFAVATPPTVALLLSTMDRNYAVAASGSTSGGGGGGKPPVTDDRGDGDDIHAGDPDNGKAGGPEHPTH